MKRRPWVWLLAWAAMGCSGGARAEQDQPGGILSGLGNRSGQVLELDLTAGAPETSEGTALFPMSAKRTYVALVRALGGAMTNDKVTGLYLQLGNTMLGWARTEELAALLGEVRSHGKPVVCHAHTLSNSSAWLVAQGCDSIWVSPAGGVDATGLSAEALYFRTALDHLKVRAEFLAVGKYKSAAEELLRDGPSDEAREALTQTLGSIRTTWLDGMKKARTKPEVRAALEHGPWSAEEARAQGLVDAVGYESEARREAEKRGRASRTTPGFGPRAGGEKLDFTELVRVLAGADEGTSGRPHIAVVPAEGSIAMRASGPFGGGGILADPLTKTLRKLKGDDSVKAVVLRIDSPGGSALASDLLWHELMELRKKKPLVASVGDMAASGGYYLASAAQRIVAERTSIVGSIGVVGGKIVLDQSLASVGINTVTFPASNEPGASARAGVESALVPWDDAVRERVRGTMQAIYDLFVRRVAEGRGRKPAEILPVAEGRIWSGAQGKERGLVDEFGGLSRALDLARELGGLDRAAPVTVEGSATSLIELFLEEDASAARVEHALARWQSRTPSLIDAVPERLRNLVGSFAPLVDDELAVAALPYALMVR